MCVLGGVGGRQWRSRGTRPAVCGVLLPSAPLLSRGSEAPVGTRHLVVIVLTHAHRTADPGEGSSSREKSLSPSVTLERRAQWVGESGRG